MNDATIGHEKWRCSGSSSNSAPKHVPTVVPVEAPAAEAVDCMQLFSSIDIGARRPALSACNPFQMTNESTYEVIATPNDQPTLSLV